jgi:hypothetical protein
MQMVVLLLHLLDQQELEWEYPQDILQAHQVELTLLDLLQID